MPSASCRTGSSGVYVDSVVKIRIVQVGTADLTDGKALLCRSTKKFRTRKIGNSCGVGVGARGRPVLLQFTQRGASAGRCRKPHSRRRGIDLGDIGHGDVSIGDL